MQSVGVVITGGAGGVGFAYADEFVRRGHKVVICDVKDPDAAVQVQSTSGFFAFCCVVCVLHNSSDVRVDSHPQAIRQKHEGGEGRIYGTVTDVSSAQSVEALAAFAKENLGTVHYWINNAGINGGRRPLTEVQRRLLRQSSRSTWSGCSSAPGSRSSSSRRNQANTQTLKTHPRKHAAKRTHPRPN